MLNRLFFESLEKIYKKPHPYEYYTTPELWCDPYISKQMLSFHLSEDVALASRTKSFIDKSINWIVDYFNIDNRTRIADFGCGPGLYSTPLAEKGAMVTGLDFSETSINYAKKQAKEKKLNIDYLLEDYLKFKANKKFDLVMMIYCDFCVLNPDQRATLLKTFYQSLDNDGSILMDVSSIALYDSMEEGASIEYSAKDGFWSANPYYVFHNNFKYEKESLLLDKFTIIEESRTRQNFNWFKCYTIDTISEELKQHGFKVVDYFLNVAGEVYQERSKEIAVVVKKIV